MSNPTTVALDATAKHSGAMSNKLTAWSGNIPTLKVESNATKANSLDVHPTSSTYGFSITTLTKTNLQNTAFVGYLSSTDNTKYRIRIDSSYAVSKVSSLGVADMTSDTYLNFTLKTIQQWANGTKAGDKEVAGADLTKVVNATSTRWIEKANGTTDANKF
jgi:hypothetical protein